ncbi:MAG: hypothetical protein QM729_21395 [Solirubrobacterales bacterium]
MVVLEGGPSGEDVRTGEPLSGNIRGPVESAFAAGGLRLSQLAVVQSWACQAPFPFKNVQARKATNCCRPLVQQTLSKLDPALPVLLAGKWAQLSVLGTERGLSAKRGYVDADWTLKDAIWNKSADAQKAAEADSGPEGADGPADEDSGGEGASDAEVG